MKALSIILLIFLICQSTIPNVDLNLSHLFQSEETISCCSADSCCDIDMDSEGNCCEDTRETCHCHHTFSSFYVISSFDLGVYIDIAKQKVKPIAANNALGSDILFAIWNPPKFLV